MTLPNYFNLHHNPLPFIDLVVSELLAKEMHFKSQAVKGIHLTPNPYILVTPQRSPVNK